MYIDLFWGLAILVIAFFAGHYFGTSRDKKKEHPNLIDCECKRAKLERIKLELLERIYERNEQIIRPNHQRRRRLPEELKDENRKIAKKVNDLRAKLGLPVFTGVQDSADT